MFQIRAITSQPFEGTILDLSVLKVSVFELWTLGDELDEVIICEHMVIFNVNIGEQRTEDREQGMI